MIIGWIQAQAVKLLGGLSAILFVALVTVMWRADKISEARDAYRDNLIAEETRHAVTRASLASLEFRLAAMVRDGELRRDRLDAALQAVDKDVAPLRIQAEQLENGLIDIRTVEGL